jgi:hypothetical protein
MRLLTANEIEDETTSTRTIGGRIRRRQNRLIEDLAGELTRLVGTEQIPLAELTPASVRERVEALLII